MTQTNPYMVPGARVRFIDETWPARREFVLGYVGATYAKVSDPQRGYYFSTQLHRVKPVVRVKLYRGISPAHGRVWAGIPRHEIGGAP